MVVSFLTGRNAAAMFDEIRRLAPDRRHFAVVLEKRGRTALPPNPGAETFDPVVLLDPGSTWALYAQLRRKFRPLRIGLAPVLFDGDPEYAALRRAAFLIAPGKLLAYNAALERHHLRVRTAISSALFLTGMPPDRISLRPKWLVPWKRDRSRRPASYRVLEGRPFTPGRRRIAVLSPYFPYPLAHGGAVRIFHLLREAARHYDIVLFAFAEGGEETGPVLDFCARAILVEKPRYREPRWSTLRPPEVCEYRAKVMQAAWDGFCRELDVALRQVEYTQLAPYGGDILVEHDVTFDLYRQVLERRRTLSAWWDWWRWRRFEKRAVRGFRRTVVMSNKDALLLRAPRMAVVPNGVDLDRFRPEPERPGSSLLFIGSFRHFPNVVAYRFLTEQVWPRLADRFPEMTLTVVAGPDPQLYWSAPPPDPRIALLGFIRDVRPLYVSANVAVVPTLVSAGTNLKTLEAMAMERAVVATTAGSAGLGVIHGESAWIADDAPGFAEGIAALLSDAALRRRLAACARRIAERDFDWRAIGETQRSLLSDLMDPVIVRPATERDLEHLDRIQKASPEAVLWEPHTYLAYECRVAETDGMVAGFVVTRALSDGESEVLSLVVDPAARRRGVASRLIKDVLARRAGTWYLEVRESNAAALNLYRKFGFEEIGMRPEYYQDTREAAVVMRRRSC